MISIDKSAYTNSKLCQIKQDTCTVQKGAFLSLNILLQIRMTYILKQATPKMLLRDLFCKEARLFASGQSASLTYRCHYFYIGHFAVHKMY